MSASGSRRCHLPERTSPGGAKVSNHSLPFNPGGRTLTFKNLSVKVLVSMSTRRVCVHGHE